MAKEMKKTIYENVKTIIDEQGELIQQTTETVKVEEKEPDFIKLYLDCVCAFNGLNKAFSPILIAMCSYMTWADSKHEKQLIWMNSMTKQAVADTLGISVARVNQALKDIVDTDIFRKIEGVRGCYEVNPYIIAKGKWSDIKGLRANFDFTKGTIEPIIQESNQMDFDDYLKKTGTEGK